MKKFLTLIVCVALTLCGVLVSCDKDDTVAPEDNTEVDNGGNNGGNTGENDGDEDDGDEDDGDEDDGDEDDGDEDDDDDDGDDDDGGDVDTTPTITWDTNPDFEPYNINGDDINIRIVVTVPNGIDSFYVTLNTDNIMLNLLIVAMGIPINTPIDLIYGEDLSLFQRIGIDCGPALFGETREVFDLTYLVELVSPYVEGMSVTVTIDLEVTDTKEQSVEQTLIFYTEADE